MLYKQDKDEDSYNKLFSLPSQLLTPLYYMNRGVEVVVNCGMCSTFGLRKQSYTQTRV